MNKTALFLSLTLLTVAVLACTCSSGSTPAETPPEQPTHVVPEAPTARPPPVPTPTVPILGPTRTRPTDGMVMVYVPAGEFQMGSTDEEVDAALELCDKFYGDCERAWFSNELPAHIVGLDTYWIDRTEVTNGQYQQCVAAGACQPPEKNSSSTYRLYYGNSMYDHFPVLYVDWHDAEAYCAWAGARLPTEAEWEYAARGPEGRIFPWGDELDGTRLNYCDVNCPYGFRDRRADDGYTDTAPVGSYPEGASWCGALDLAGNVWEWTADWYGEYPSERQVNPPGPASGEHRVMRGGGWGLSWYSVRTATRLTFPPDDCGHYLGFRCAASAGE